MKQQKSQDMLDIKWNIYIYFNVLNESIENYLPFEVLTHGYIL